ncbi:hypothetical protein M431DRAFT_404342 [Trichoderma harzianum CBS 226.95]|uniref:Uncharacterized protein n=1 Tax=Trichoderma harzianum CBS 226.95 TaxID=983964 RepID=A0A2T4AET5_TRIHA|nr:hypothetical protein M431DRAFT_404342 [Trichoderma harzianum CBS 226.95]PTB55587.1 hypothetical protein M431DRAFT_404342 [Trichoderma harzianum CBS 226.95]
MISIRNSPNGSDEMRPTFLIALCFCLGTKLGTACAISTRSEILRGKSLTDTEGRIAVECYSGPLFSPRAAEPNIDAAVARIERIDETLRSCLTVLELSSALRRMACSLIWRRHGPLKERPKLLQGCLCL